MSNGFFGSASSGAAGAERSPAAPPDGEGFSKDVTTASFAADVVAASRRQPVIVDFWAPWCGPCKQLTPILERAVAAAKGRVRLARMNIDEHPSIAGQLGVRSIPAVFAFVDGQPVDGFMGAVPESEVKAFIDRLTAGGGGTQEAVAEAVAEARRRFEGGDVPGAAQLFAAVLQEEPDHLGAVAGLADCYLALGDAERAEALLGAVPAERQAAPELAGVRAKLKLAAETAGLGDPAALRRRLDANADDHQARFDLALIAQAQGRRAEAGEQLLEVVRRDRGWNEDGARRKLLELFEAWGPADAATRDGRRKLSALLFR